MSSLDQSLGRVHDSTQRLYQAALENADRDLIRTRRAAQISWANEARSAGATEEMIAATIQRALQESTVAAS